MRSQSSPSLPSRTRSSGLRSLSLETEVQEQWFPVEPYIPVSSVNHCGIKTSLAVSNRSLHIELDAQNAFIVSKQKSKSDCISGYTASKFIYTYHSSWIKYRRRQLGYRRYLFTWPTERCTRSADNLELRD